VIQRREEAAAAYIFVNNRLEGNAASTIQAVVEECEAYIRFTVAVRQRPDY
jgi:hypothetical protein